MKFVPTLAHALADLKMSLNPPTSTKTSNLMIQRELVASTIRHSLELMVSNNKTDQATNLVNELIEKQIECDPSDVFFHSCAQGNLEIIKIFERYKPVRSENLPQCVMLALDRGQMEAAHWALQKAQEYWGEMAKDHLNADQLIAKTIDSHMLTRQNVHEVVQWLVPFNTADLSFAVVRASMREYKNTARFLLKHSDPQQVLDQIGDNHADPKMQWLMDLINKNQRTTLRKSVSKPPRPSKRKM
jgi:hypothetical protein